MPSLSIIIPVYRSERILPELHRRLVRALEEIGSPFEIILVEDGGGDHSWPIIEDLARADHRVRGIRMSRNYGQHNALLCGIRAAQHEIIVTMDDDLQNPVSEIAPMLAALTPDYDAVYGAPQTEQHGFLRNVASRLTKIALTSAMGAETARNVSAFRAFRTRLREGFRDYRSPYVSIDVRLLEDRRCAGGQRDRRMETDGLQPGRRLWRGLHRRKRDDPGRGPRRLDEGRAAPSVRHPHGQARSFLPAVRNGGSARPRDAYRASFSPFRPTVFRAEGGDAKGDDDCARRGLSCDAIGGVACAEARPGAEHGAGGRAGRRRTFVDGRTELYLGGLLKKAWDAEGDKSDAAFAVE